MKRNIFKLLLLLAFFPFLQEQANAQTTVTIGSGTATNSYFPIYSCYGYNYSQQIYLGSEITGGGWSGTGQITKIRFYLGTAASTPANYNNWTVYLGNTSQTSFSNSANWVPVGSLTSVFTGIVDVAGSGWKEITLSTPFVYSGGNLVVAVDENSPGYSCTASWRSYTSTAGNRSLLYYNDGTNPNPASPPSANYGPNATLAQFQFVIDGAAPCSGTPGVAVANSSVPNACAGTPFTLSASGLPSGVSGITYQWQSRPAGGGAFTNISGANTAVYSVPNQTAPTEYQLLVTCTSTGGGTSTSNVLLIGQNPPSACFCVPTTTGSSTYYINNFTTTGGITNISNTSGSGAGGYQDFHTTISGSAYQGATVNYSIGVAGGSNYGRAIWIDLNEDGDFADPGEQVASGTTYEYPPLTGSFSIPAGTMPGNKRMRVVATYTPGNPSNPCVNSGDGEYEDYTFTVVTLPPCTGMPAPGLATAFSTISVSGYNADIIANGIGLPSTSTSAPADAADFYFVSSDYRTTPTSSAPTYSLPANGLINASGLSGLKFKIPDYGGNNSLRLASATPGTLVWNTPAPATTVYLLATTGSGPGTISATVYFGDGTNQAFTGLTVPDWYGGTVNVAVQGIGRVGGTGILEGNSSNPRLYFVPLPIATASQSKLIDSVVLTRTSSGGIVNIMGVSAQTPKPENYPLCGSFSTVLNLTGTSGNYSGLSYQWQESSTPTGPFTDVSGASGMSYTTPVLSANKYYRVKATCAGSGMSSYSDTVAVTLLPPVAISSQPVDVNACDGSPVTLNVGVPAGTGYQWYMGTTPITGATGSSLNIPSATTADAGTYFVLLNGCTSSDTVTLAVSPSFPVNLGNDTTICTGNTISLNAGNPGASYVWSTGSTAASITTGMAGTYSVAVTSGACTVSDTLVLTTNTYPVVNLGNDTAICAGSSLTLNAGNPGAFYSWNTGASSQTISVSTAGSYQVMVTNGVCATRDTLVLTVNNYPVVNLGNDTAICAGASLTLNAGNPGASYIWSTGAFTQTISVSTAGSYKVSVANGLCVAKDTIVVTVNNYPVVNLGADTAICAGTPLTLNAGNPGATYTWSTGAITQTVSVSGSGTYSVTVANGSCTTTDNIVVTAATLPVVALGNDSAICAGNTITLNAGNPGATYVWSTGATSQTISVATAGNYSVAVTNGACHASDTISIAVNPIPVVDLGADTTICTTTMLTLDAGNPGAAYVWNTGENTQTISLSAAGSYSVMVANGACVAGDTVDISEVPAPVAATIVTVDNMPEFDFSAPGSTGAATYAWDFGDGTTAATETASHAYTANGVFTVTLVVTNECGQTGSVTTTVTVSGVGIGSVNGQVALVQVYPNPSNSLTVVEAKGATIQTIEVVDNLGRVIQRTQPNAAKTVIDVKGMAQGIYTLRIQTTQGSSIVKLVVGS